MSILSFFLFLLVAFITGSIGASLAGRRKLGCLTSIALGFIGAFIGTLIARQLNLPMYLNIKIGGHYFPLIWAIIGAAIFIAVLNLLARKR
ncbi:MAG: GlsB/YeaQ/YmgE family stress response membrane protein [Candidatus Aminicenantia bacterium]